MNVPELMTGSVVVVVVGRGLVVVVTRWVVVVVGRTVVAVTEVVGELSLSEFVLAPPAKPAIKMRAINPHPHTGSRAKRRVNQEVFMPSTVRIGCDRDERKYIARADKCSNEVGHRYSIPTVLLLLAPSVETASKVCLD